MQYTVKLTTELIVEQTANSPDEAIAQALQLVPAWLSWRADVVDTPQDDQNYNYTLPGMLDDEWEDD